jgi:hypothetical protein
LTIKDIARESGYAVGTVSRVLNNNPRVSEDARRKILAVVAQHGYQPNANAKHLKQQVPEGLALIVKGTQNALFADLLDKLQPCLEARGYTPTVYYNNVSTDELACAQTIFAERRPCGLFFIGAHPQCFTPALASLGIPCLLLTNNAAGLGICHSLAHALGGRFHLPHGRLNALILPHVIHFNAADGTAAEKYGRLARLCGLAANPRSLAAGLNRLRAQLKLPERLSACGVEGKELTAALDGLAEAAQADLCAPSNPRPAAAEDLKSLLRELA